ncbi:MAG TPA: hypothetical protein VJ865_08940 [Gemmatimonadaceae bacterium]|nr:hypothetical protein [Gemmatimonadaceae bacterium]
MATSSSEPTTQAGWIGRALVYALFYMLVGVLVAQFAGHFAFVAPRVWRLTAWLASAIAFGTHIQYERLTAGRSILVTGLHAATAAALGAFGLALAAIVHRHGVGLPRSGLLGAALVIWPVITFIPALMVGMGAAALMRPRVIAP